MLSNSIALSWLQSSDRVRDFGIRLQGSDSLAVV